jgi:hypothetical protein
MKNAPYSGRMIAVANLGLPAEVSQNPRDFITEQASDGIHFFCADGHVGREVAGHLVELAIGPRGARCETPSMISRRGRPRLHFLPGMRLGHGAGIAQDNDRCDPESSQVWSAVSGLSMMHLISSPSDFGPVEPVFSQRPI